MNDWKIIKNFNNYCVNKIGQIKNIKTNKILRLNTDKDGYKTVMLYNNKKFKRFKVHRLVAEAFIPNINNLPLINHKNEIKDDNRVENLEFCDYKYNSNYGNCIEKSASKRRKSVIQYSKDMKIIKIWESASKVEKELNIYATKITACCNGKRKSAGGYIWKKVGDLVW